MGKNLLEIRLYFVFILLSNYLRNEMLQEKINMYFFIIELVSKILEIIS